MGYAINPPSISLEEIKYGQCQQELAQLKSNCGQQVVAAGGITDADLTGAVEEAP